MNLDDLQNDVPETINTLRSVLADLECAESCSSVEDFAENIATALERIALIRKELVSLAKKAEKAK